MPTITEQIKKWYYPITGIFGLSLVILVHEFGHFITAKLFGVATPIFSIGFGPKLIALKFGQTTFQIAMIPFGGYVSMIPADLAAQPYFNKLIILSAGIIFNMLFAYIVLVYLAFRGTYTALPIVKQVIPNSPASNAGIQDNDRFIAIDEQSINDDVTLILHYIAQSPDKTVTITMEREGLRNNIPVTLGTDHPVYGQNIGWLGVRWQTIKTSQPTLWQALTQTRKIMRSMIRNLAQFTSKIGKKGQRGGFIGPIGIIMMIGKSLALSPQYFVLVLALVSINVGLFNLLPIPFLDGGKLLQYTMEAAFGPLPPNLIFYISLIFFVLFLLLIFSVTKDDVKRLRK